jgi:eukaryotic-like serine/threonine-protein kinase
VAIYAINLASVQLARRQPASAEELLNQALPIRARAPNIVPSRRRTIPDDDWSVAATKTLLAAALVAERRYREAESILLDTRRDLEARPDSPARDVKATLAGLVQLYDAWGRPDVAATYRARLRS